MANQHHYTDEEKTELLCNPYTARVTDCKVIFTLAFKQLVLDNIDKPGMTARKIFRMAGYRDDIFSRRVRNYVIQSVRREAASPQGLQGPAPVKKTVHRKKLTETEFRELQDRVLILEQQIDFLKKSNHLRQNPPTPPFSSS